MANQSFHEVLTAAVADLSEHGYDDPRRVEKWTELLREAAARATQSTHLLEHALREALGEIYRRLAEKGQVLKRHPGVGRFTLDRIKPELRKELDRRILASANLIRLNRNEAISNTLRRFQGWSTSIPQGGSDNVDKRATKRDIGKPIQSLPFVERRVLIDQGHKLTSAINETVAKSGGAIACQWHSLWREPNYNYRPDHKERDQHIYLMRDSWALDKGLIKPGPDGYYDEITAVGEEPFCRCYLTFYYHLRQLPKDMLTIKGAKELARVSLD